jgi:nucleoside-diphosphate-sugar epimerase
MLSPSRREHVGDSHEHAYPLPRESMAPHRYQSRLLATISHIGAVAPEMAKLVIGCGYLGARVARKWLDSGHSVTVVTRSDERAERFRQKGFDAIVADVTRPETLTQLPVAESVLFAVGFDRDSKNSIQHVYADGMRNVLAALPAETGRLIYISTTGVYGPADGGWVDEVTAPDPQRDGGRASLAAEERIAAHPLRQRSVILRLAGIYGPGRVPFIRELRADEPIAAPASGWLNLIHVDDAVEAVVAACELEPFRDGPRVYCVSDGQPVQRGEFYSEVARQIGAQPPRFVEPDPNSPRTARAEANRRISNARMLADLRVTLAYPNYRAGLAEAVESRTQ